MSCCRSTFVSIGQQTKRQQGKTAVSTRYRRSAGKARLVKGALRQSAGPRAATFEPAVGKNRLGQ